MIERKVDANEKMMKGDSLVAMDDKSDDGRRNS